MLEVRSIEAGYGEAQVLFGIDFEVGAGEVVALLGRNGMGKTTTVRAIFGLLPVTAGRVLFEGRELNGKPPFEIAQMGLGLVPEGRQVFPTLTVEENLIATAAARFGSPRWQLPDIYRLFPSLKARSGYLGSQLSGGEQQMLAIGRALMTNPKLIVLDEATEGLAPLIRDEIWSCLARLKAEAQAIVVIDKSIDELMKLADRHVVIEKGRVVWSGSSAALAASPAVAERHLHVGGAVAGASPSRADTTTKPCDSAGKPRRRGPLDATPIRTHLVIVSDLEGPTPVPTYQEEHPMAVMTPGVTRAGEGIDNISWSILGQTYVPKQVSETSFSWHATFPPGTFVPPHIHPTQDEFIYMLEGEFELMLDGKTHSAKPGDLIRMPMGIPHGIFNKSDRTVKCFFWVSPTRRLFDLFWAIHNMAEQTPAEVVALSAKHEVDFLPPPEEKP